MEGKSGVPEESKTDPEPPSAALREAVPLVRGLVLGRRYVIETVLGRGGMGVVARAYDRTLRETVAIKILRPELSAERRWIDRLAREVKLTRQIRHPNVCRVFGFEQADGHTFLVLELASGGSLRTEIVSGALQSRPLAHRLADVRAIIAGLAAIHEAGIVHRDTTPQNVLRMADGRLVLSDFGLAIDASETTTSIHGGTVAYMAPEVLRGGRANFASDVWALGVLIHEVVFGEKPRWRTPIGGGLLSPRTRETLTRQERIALNVCRSCMSENPQQRPRSASEVKTQLDGGSQLRLRVPRWILPLAVLTAMAMLAARMWAHQQVPRAAPPEEVNLLVPSGQPADWTQASKVIATIDDRIRCVALLPDHKTLRFAWGTPAHCEDIDLQTSRRTPSPVVTDACREGCPDLSSDGRRLVYQGYTPDGIANAFVSSNPDGRDAVATIPIADPSLMSEPRWLKRGDAFVYAADAKHVGVYSLVTKRPSILPDPTNEPYVTSFFFVLGDQIFVAAPMDHNSTAQVVGFEWPSLVDAVRFRVPERLLALSSPGDGTFFASAGHIGHPLVRISPQRNTAAKFALVRDQFIRYSLFAADRLAFVSIGAASDVWAVDEAGQLRQVTHDGRSYHATPCGSDIALTVLEADRFYVVRTDRSGRPIGKLAPGPRDMDPACSPDGKTWFFIRIGDGIYRCDSTDCLRLVPGSFHTLAISPDGSRMAVISIPRRAPVVAWLSTTGGPLHDVGESETTCEPAWSSNTTLWISHRQGHDLVWTEIEADNGQPTGRTARGGKDCTDGIEDPLSPLKRPVRSIARQRSQIRTLPWPWPESRSF